MSLPIRYDSTETGAPTVNNAAGTVITLLRAVLRDGFNVKAITAIVVTSEVATVQCPTHGYACGFAQLVLISGASVPALNGNKQPTLVDGNYFTFPAPGVADGSYTASDARRAPLGWTEAYTNGGGTVSIFARSAPEATTQMLRVDDANTGVSASGFARSLIVESASDVDIYTGPSPTEAMVSGGARWQKGNNNSTLKKWVVVGTDRGFWIGIQIGTADQFVPVYFGDGVPYYPGDAYFTLLTGQTSATINTTPAFTLSTMLSYSTAATASHSNYVSRGLLPASTSGENFIVCGANAGGVAANSTLQSAVTFSNLAVAPVCHVVGSGKEVRGELPGLAIPLAAAPFASMDVVAVGERQYLCVPYNASGQPGQYLLRLDDWGF